MADPDGDPGDDTPAETNAGDGAGDAAGDGVGAASPDAEVTEDTGDDDERRSGPLLTRRRALVAGTLGALGAATGYWWLSRDDEPNPPFERVGASTSTDTQTENTDQGAAVARALAEKYAPALRFGKYERWYPTDPRQYATERGGETVVNGFDALDGYTRERRSNDALPAPTVFYNVLELPESALTVVQYWMYSVFDQFAVNFHWHDWELLQVFVDTDADRPVLVDASAHARTVPNNEYLVSADESIHVGVLSEVGSHSSTTAVNSHEATFQRLPLDGVPPDVTNATLDLADLLGLPFAYGLPRDEGGALPYAIPELDGKPLYDHPDLPNVSAADLVPEPLTVRSYNERSSPPDFVPRREHGRTVTAATDDRDSDATYDLVDVREVEHIAAFEGPQLGFEFAVPKFVEDGFATHLTSVGVPWEQPRFTNPLEDVTDSRHRQFLKDEYIQQSAALSRPAGATSTLFASAGLASAGLTSAGLTSAGLASAGLAAGNPASTSLGSRTSRAGSAAGAQSSPNVLMAVVEEVESGSAGTLRNAPEGARDVFGDRIGVSVRQPRVEPVVRLDGDDPVAVPTVGGVARFVDVPEGDRELVVNGAGYAPHAQRVPHDGGLTLPGGNGRMGLVARDNAVKVRGELEGLQWVRVDEDFAGSLHYHQPVGEGRFGLYLHRDGTYNLEIQDGDGGLGVFRVKPGTGTDASDDGDGDSDDSDGTDDELVDGNTTTGDGTGENATGGNATTGNLTGGNATRGNPAVGDDLASPAPTARLTVELGTGKGPIARFLEEYLADTVELSRSVETDADLRGSATRGFEQSLDGTRTAVAAVERNAPDAADRALVTLRDRLASLEKRIEERRSDELPPAAATVLSRRVETADYRAQQALDQPL